MDTELLDLPTGVVPDPSEFVQAVMRWHFGHETGSRFWLERAKTLGFDPIADVHGFEDLKLFPNVTDELRDVPVEDLIPRGFGPRPDVVSVIESGGTTGSPKRLPLLREFAQRIIDTEVQELNAAGVSPDKHWLSTLPSGPHGALDQSRRSASAFGNGIVVFAIDIDPRWVKKQVAKGNSSGVDEYVDHVVEQATYILRAQNVGFLRVTAPVLARLVEDDDMVELIQSKIQRIGWGGASMDPASRHYYLTELFPDIDMKSAYGTTMALGAGARERPDIAPDAGCILDPRMAPYVTLQVVDPKTGESVAEGERGQVVVNHLSKSFLLPNNAERDEATRVRPHRDDIFGDAVADVLPLQAFGGTKVIEGVY